MGEGDETRLIAWHREMQDAHHRLRRALRVVQDAARNAIAVPTPERDLLLFCHGFCVALSGHHEGEDTALFPALLRAHPELTPVVTRLQQDHDMIGHLIRDLTAALVRRDPSAAVLSHVEGVAAIMESHFRYEERELLEVLERLDLPIDPHTALGPL